MYKSRVGDSQTRTELISEPVLIHFLAREVLGLEGVSRMFRAGLAIAAVAFLLCCSSHAFAAYDPCYAQSRQVYYTERQFDTAQRNVATEQNRFYNAQNQVDIRLSNLRFQVDQAQANMRASSAYTGGYAASCAIRSIFFRGGWCWAGVANSAIMRRVSARNYYNLAVSRYNSYVVYAGGYLARMGQRVVFAQQQYDQSKAAYEAAVVSYQQCTAANAQTAT